MLKTAILTNYLHVFLLHHAPVWQAKRLKNDAVRVGKSAKTGQVLNSKAGSPRLKTIQLRTDNMTTLHATPYNIDALGFYFDNAIDYESKAATHVDRYGNLVEEFEIQFIDGDDAQLFEA